MWMASTSEASARRRVQYAALPYRQRQDGDVQIRLVTSRETRRWVIPKGWPMKGMSPPKAAAREAYEEAGLMGTISSNPIGLYTYEKRLSATRSVLCDVMVFPMKVKRYLKNWPEQSQRVGFWFSIESAASAVQEEELSELILRFGAAMAERHAQKLAKQAEATAAKQVAALAKQADDLAAENAPASGRGTAKKPLAVKPEAAVGTLLPVSPASAKAAKRASQGKVTADRAGTQASRKGKAKALLSDGPLMVSDTGEATAPAAPDAKSEAKKTELKKAEPKKAEPKKVEPKKAEPKKAELKKVEPKKAEAKKAQPKKAEPEQVEPKKAEPKKAAPKKAAPKKAEAKKLEPKKVAAKKAESTKAEPAKAAPKKAVPKKTEVKKKVTGSAGSQPLTSTDPAALPGTGSATPVTRTGKAKKAGGDKKKGGLDSPTTSASKETASAKTTRDKKPTSKKASV